MAERLKRIDTQITRYGLVIVPLSSGLVPRRQDMFAPT
jgi:hypothetical protein